jgi:hypothetical protein
LSERINTPLAHTVNEEVMTFYLTTTEIGRVVFRLRAKFGRDEIHVAADRSDLETIILFMALGLSLTAVFFSLGFGPEIGRILAASG